MALRGRAVLRSEVFAGAVQDTPSFDRSVIRNVEEGAFREAHASSAEFTHTPRPGSGEVRMIDARRRSALKAARKDSETLKRSGEVTSALDVRPTPAPSARRRAEPKPKPTAAAPKPPGPAPSEKLPPMTGFAAELFARKDPPPSAPRVPLLDVLIQGAAIAVFSSVGVAIAPQTPMTLAVSAFAPEFPVGTIALRQGNGSATLVLSIPEHVRAQLERNLGRRSDGRDLIRELVNQVVGCIKNRLAQYQVTLRPSLPGSMDRLQELEHLTPTTGALSVYPFRTTHGQIYVAIKGPLSETPLAYSGATNVGAEGDIIVF